MTPASSEPRRDRAGPEGARASPFPDDVHPQLATRVSSAPRGDEWLHEVKLDGYRILAELRAGDVRLLTRRRNDWTARYSPVVDALSGLHVEEALLDGEVTVLRPDGRSSFEMLQRWEETSPRRPLTYFVFDLLYLDGYDLRALPLTRRKELLTFVVPSDPDSAGGPAGPGGRVSGSASTVRYCDHVRGGGPAFFREGCRLGLEGIISKAVGAPYRSGRTKEWKKVKCVNRQEFVVGGYTDPSGSRVGFGALLLGYHDAEGRLRYSGKVGTGFRQRTLRELQARLEDRIRDSPAFVDPPPPSKEEHWVDPEVVVDVEFTEWTRDGVLRHPSFKGIREDLQPSDVTREREDA